MFKNSLFLQKIHLFLKNVKTKFKNNVLDSTLIKKYNFLCIP